VPGLQATPDRGSAELNPAHDLDAPRRTKEITVSPSVRVDPVACDAFGYCAELLPDRVSLDEWGYPVVDGRPLDPRLVGLALTAVAACPRRAFHLVA
jgi:ferredoxin